ncbi:hypothetical protein D3C81_1889360 [compost metagenome]
MVKQGEPVIICVHRLVRHIPLTQDMRYLDQALFLNDLTQYAGQLFADDIGLMKIGDFPLSQDRVGQCYTETCKIERLGQCGQ